MPRHSVDSQAGETAAANVTLPGESEMLVPHMTRQRVLCTKGNRALEKGAFEMTANQLHLVETLTAKVVLLEELRVAPLEKVNSVQLCM